MAPHSPVSPCEDGYTGPPIQHSYQQPRKMHLALHPPGHNQALEYYESLPPARVSVRQAFIRFFLPGWETRWTERRPSKANSSMRKRIWRNLLKLMHSVIAMLIPVILLLPLAELFRFKVDTGNKDQYFAVSLLRTWSGIGSEGEYNGLTIFLKGNKAQALPDQLIVTALWIQVIVSLILLIATCTLTSYLGVEPDPSSFRLSRKGRGNRIWLGVGLATTLQFFLFVILALIFGIYTQIWKAKLPGTDYAHYLGGSGIGLLCAIMIRAMFDICNARASTRNPSAA